MKCICRHASKFKGGKLCSTNRPGQEGNNYQSSSGAGDETEENITRLLHGKSGGRISSFTHTNRGGGKSHSRDRPSRG